MQTFLQTLVVALATPALLIVFGQIPGLPGDLTYDSSRYFYGSKQNSIDLKPPGFRGGPFPTGKIEIWNFPEPEVDGFYPQGPFQMSPRVLPPPVKEGSNYELQSWTIPIYEPEIVGGDKPFLYEAAEVKKCVDTGCLCPLMYNPICGFDSNPRRRPFDPGFRTFGNICAFQCASLCNSGLSFLHCGECVPVLNVEANYYPTKSLTELPSDCLPGNYVEPPIPTILPPSYPSPLSAFFDTILNH